MSEWKEYRLREVTTKIGSGATPIGGSNAYKSAGTSLIRSQNVLDFKFSFDGLAYIDDEQANGLKNVNIEENDVLLNITGDSVARVCKVPKKVLPARVNQHVAIIRADGNKTNANFILYYLQSIKEQLLIHSEIGGTRNALTKAMIENLDISLPSLPEQCSIASILSSLDDKIDLLHRQNATLEKMAEILFRQWFVEESKKNWEVEKLGNIVDVLIGRTPPRKETKWFSLNPSDVKWISIKDMGDAGVFIFHTSEYLTKEAVSVFNIPIIPKDTVVLSFKMTVGRVAITNEEMLSNEAIAQFKFNKTMPFTKEFLYLFLKTFKYDLLGTTSSIVTSINSSMIKDIEVMIPDQATMQRFKVATECFFDKIKTNQSQIRTLTQLRDVLLPKLMSGEVRVREINK